MHHKRKRPRNLRAGCKMCKPWKVNGVNKWSKEMGRHADRKRLVEGPVLELFAAHWLGHEATISKLVDIVDEVLEDDLVRRDDFLQALQAVDILMGQRGSSRD